MVSEYTPWNKRQGKSTLASNLKKLITFQVVIEDGQIKKKRISWAEMLSTELITLNYSVILSHQRSTPVKEP